jgi:hypothetical protein
MGGGYEALSPVYAPEAQIEGSVVQPTTPTYWSHQSNPRLIFHGVSPEHLAELRRICQRHQIPEGNRYGQKGRLSR